MSKLAAYSQRSWCGVRDCLQRQRRNARFRSLTRGLKRRNGRVPVSQATMCLRDCLVLDASKMPFLCWVLPLGPC